MSIDAVEAVDAMFDVTQACVDDEHAQIRVQLYGGNNELLAEVNIGNEFNIGQLTACLRSSDDSNEDTLRACENELGYSSQTGRLRRSGL